MKITTIVGARPQFIKAAVVSRALQQLGDGAEEQIVHTGQHYDANMSALFFDELQIPQPSLNLEIANCSHGAMTGRMLERIESVLEADRPDAVLVYGDTNSTMAGALAAVKLHIPVAHVEAGLRSFNTAMPEEINRVVTDRISDRLYAPTQTAVDHLAREGTEDQRVELVGDVMFDAARFYGTLADERSAVLQRHGLRAGAFALATVHRQENTDDPVRLAGIFEGLRRAARETPLVLPLHPRTRACVRGAEGLLDGLTIIDPVGYLDMVMLERSAAAVLTDSGGVQKEAYFHGTPCVTLRDETEWVELVDCGANRLVGADADAIETGFHAALRATVPKEPLYGRGDAGERIAVDLQRVLAQ